MAVQIKYGGSTIATVAGTSAATKRLLTQEKICRDNIEVAVTPPTAETRNVTPSGSQQVITPSTGYDYLSSVTVAAVQAESRTVTPSGSQQVITPGTGYNYLSRVTVSAIPTETKSAELSMASGNQTVSATSGRYMTAVTINKPATLLAANIKKGVNIGGVTGTYEGSGGGGGGDDEYSISPSTQTWQHNTYVSIGLDIAADGSLTVYKSSGSGTANNLVICYPQSDTYSAANEITSIPIPQAEGTYTMDITVWWDNQSGEHNDHNNHTISYTVVKGGGGGGDTKDIQVYHGMVSTAQRNLTATGVKVTVAKTGTYKISWMAARSASSSSQTASTRLYVNSQAKDTDRTTWTNTYGQSVTITNFALTQGQTVEVYARSGSTSTYVMVGNLIVEQTA